jgi:hypothetical protein
MGGTTPAHQIDSTISNICARLRQTTWMSSAILWVMLRQKMTTPRCVSDNDDALRRCDKVLKTSNDAERVPREYDSYSSSNALHIISFQEANCYVDSNASPPTRFETPHATIAQTAHRTTKISKPNIQYSVHQ